MFHMLNSHVMELRSKRRREQRINSLLAQLSVDSDTLLSEFYDFDTLYKLLLLVLAYFS